MQVTFKVGLGREAGFKGRTFFWHFNLMGVRLPRRTGKVAQVIFPIRVARKFLFINAVRVFFGLAQILKVINAAFLLAA